MKIIKVTSLLGAKSADGKLTGGTKRPVKTSTKADPGLTPDPETAKRTPGRLG